MKQAKPLTKEQYLKKFSRAVRWRLPPQESEDAISDYRELIFQEERDESRLVEELGEPVQAAHLLTDVRTYRRWLAVFAVLATILEEGDEILVPDPVWLNYINVPSLLGAKAVTYGLTEETGFQMDLEEVKAKITPKTRAIVIITPNNPTGGVLSEDVLKELAEIAASNDLMVISDEVYERLEGEMAENG